MAQSLVDNFKAQLFERNCVTFNFFLAKPINQLLAGRHVPHVIRFADLTVILQDDVEYLKRYYHQSEVDVRITKLSEFYTENLVPPEPNLCPTSPFHIFKKRTKRRLRQQHKAQRDDQSADDPRSQMLYDLEDLSISDLDPRDSTLQEQPHKHASKQLLEGESHDIYADFEVPERLQESYNPALILDSTTIDPRIIIDFATAPSESNKPTKQTKQQPEPTAPSQKPSFMEYYYSLKPREPQLVKRLYTESARKAGIA